MHTQAFFYDWLDRNAAKKGKPLPEKIGSMQFFLHGFTGVFHVVSRRTPALPTRSQMLPTSCGNIHGQDARSPIPSMTTATGKGVSTRNSSASSRLSVERLVRKRIMMTMMTRTVACFTTGRRAAQANRSTGHLLYKTISEKNLRSMSFSLLVLT